MGHATRSIAIIRELIKEGIEVTIRSSNVDYLKKSLPNVKIISGITDIGPTIEKNGISINEKKTLESMGKWIDSINLISEKELEIISEIKPNLVISDISAMPFFASHKAQINSVAISNFSWVDVLKEFPSKQIDILNEAYRLANMAIQLPLGPQMKPFEKIKKVGLVCKKPTDSRKSIREKIGLKESEICVFVNLSNDFVFKPKIADNVKIISTGARIQSDNVKYIKPWIEGQNLIIASDLVICKCGYGMISECITNGIPFLYISDNNHLEQKVISEKLIKKGFSNRIIKKDLDNIVLSKDSISKIKSKKENNAVDQVTDILKKILNDKFKKIELNE
jgi:UDP:flavonoid glycosyltransferase YjiC (YdhE family)